MDIFTPGDKPACLLLLTSGCHNSLSVLCLLCGDFLPHVVGGPQHVRIGRSSRLNLHYSLPISLCRRELATEFDFPFRLSDHPILGYFIALYTLHYKELFISTVTQIERSDQNQKPSQEKFCSVQSLLAYGSDWKLNIFQLRKSEYFELYSSLGYQRFFCIENKFYSYILSKFFCLQMKHKFNCNLDQNNEYEKIC